jgi:CheY-like chemotaxis protein
MKEGKPEKKFRIMFVDDDLEMEPLYQYACRVNDLIFAVKGGGLSALRHLNDINYDIDAVILDLSMPDMDGITLTENIRRNESIRSKAVPIRIFWFTGHPFDIDNPVDPITLAMNENQVEEIFTKPLAPVDLVTRVKEHLNA